MEEKQAQRDGKSLIMEIVLLSCLLNLAEEFSVNLNCSTLFRFSLIPNWLQQ